MSPSPTPVPARSGLAALIERMNALADEHSQDRSGLKAAQDFNPDGSRKSPGQRDG